MSKQANNTLIGAFVMGAVALIMVIVVIFGSGRFFRNVHRYVMFFEGSVGGLIIGSAVEYRGVRIGEVINIEVYQRSSDLTYWVPVTVEIDEDRIHSTEAVDRKSDDLDTSTEIDRGLRAKLSLKSLVTGQLAVSMDLYPDTPVRLVDIPTPYPQIPTIPSKMERAGVLINELLSGELVEHVTGILRGLNALVNSHQTQAIPVNANAALVATRRTVESVGRRIEPLLENLARAEESVRLTADVMRRRLALEEGEPLYTFNHAMEDFGRLTRSADRELTSLSGALRVSAGKMDSALDEARLTLITLRGLVEPGSQIYNQLSQLLRTLTETSVSVRNLADYLERHPESLLRGKGRR